MFTTLLIALGVVFLFLIAGYLSQIARHLAVLVNAVALLQLAENGNFKDAA